MSLKIKSIIAIVFGILPINILMLWYRFSHEEGFTSTNMLVYPLIFGTGLTLWILALNRFLLKRPVRDFSPANGTWYWDIAIGLGLTALYFLLALIGRATLARILPSGRPASQEVLDLMISLSENPLLLALWLGPVVWIGVALFEEIQRVFIMNCLWRLSSNSYWEIAAIVLVALLWGAMHLYQGLFGFVTVSIQGLVMGIWFYKSRRIWPLIISHALYDSIQILMLVVQTS
jgi:membrane protease YdiL (CAAX protease family)